MPNLTSHGHSPLQSPNLVPLILALDHGSVYRGVQRAHAGPSYSSTTAEGDLSALDCLGPVTETHQDECRLHLVCGHSYMATIMPALDGLRSFVVSLKIRNSEFKFCFGHSRFLAFSCDV